MKYGDRRLENDSVAYKGLLNIFPYHCFYYFSPHHDGDGCGLVKTIVHIVLNHITSYSACLSYYICYFIYIISYYILYWLLYARMHGIHRMFQIEILLMWRSFWWKPVNKMIVWMVALFKQLSNLCPFKFLISFRFFRR